MYTPENPLETQARRTAVSPISDEERDMPVSRCFPVMLFGICGRGEDRCVCGRGRWMCVWEGEGWMCGRRRRGGMVEWPCLNSKGVKLYRFAHPRQTNSRVHVRSI